MPLKAPWGKGGRRVGDSRSSVAGPRSGAVVRQQDRTACFGVILAHGPEVRAFVHSGLLTRLQRSARVVLFCRVPDSPTVLSVRDLQVHAMPDCRERRLLGKLRSLALRAQQRALLNQGRAIWRHYLPPDRSVSSERQSRRSSPLRAILRRNLAYAIARLEFVAGRALGSVSDWKRLYRSSGVTHVMAASYASPAVLPALQTAANLGLMRLVITNSWKDVYTTTHVPVPLDAIVVQHEQAARDLIEANPRYLTPRILHVAESLHLQPFRTPPQQMDRSSFCGRFGLDPARPFICYSAASPRSVEREENIVGALAEAFARPSEKLSPQILLRLNPMEDGSRFVSLAARYPDIRTQRPDWEWEPEIDWCCARETDVQTWVATIFHSSLNVSIPSTVTLEYAEMKRPVVNVCFDLPENQPIERSARRFWESEFYRLIRNDGAVVGSFSLGELLANVRAALNRGSTCEEQLTRHGPTPVDHVMDIVEEVRNL